MLFNISNLEISLTGETGLRFILSVTGIAGNPS
jgi:hypothetical protein